MALILSISLLATAFCVLLGAYLLALHILNGKAQLSSHENVAMVMAWLVDKGGRPPTIEEILNEMNVQAKQVAPFEGGEKWESLSVDGLLRKTPPPQIEVLKVRETREGGLLCDCRVQWPDCVPGVVVGVVLGGEKITCDLQVDWIIMNATLHISVKPNKDTIISWKQTQSPFFTLSCLITSPDHWKAKIDITKPPSMNYTPDNQVSEGLASSVAEGIHSLLDQFNIENLRLPHESINEQEEDTKEEGRGKEEVPHEEDVPPSEREKEPLLEESCRKPEEREENGDLAPSMAEAPPVAEAPPIAEDFITIPVHGNIDKDKTPTPFDNDPALPRQRSHSSNSHSSESGIVDDEEIANDDDIQETGSHQQSTVQGDDINIPLLTINGINDKPRPPSSDSQKAYVAMTTTEPCPPQNSDSLSVGGVSSDLDVTPTHLGTTSTVTGTTSTVPNETTPMHETTPPSSPATEQVPTNSESPETQSSWKRSPSYEQLESICPPVEPSPETRPSPPSYLSVLRPSGRSEDDLLRLGESIDDKWAARRTMTLSVRSYDTDSPVLSRKGVLPSMLVYEIHDDGYVKHIVAHSVAHAAKLRKIFTNYTKLHIYNDHTFTAVHTSGKPTCPVCSEKIAGIFGKQAYSCRDCQLKVHKPCHYKVESSCHKSKVSSMNLIHPDSVSVSSRW